MIARGGFSDDVWLATGAGLTVPLASSVGRIPLDDWTTSEAERDLRTMPELLRVELGTEVARWALLRPVQFDGQTVSYRARAGGDLSRGLPADARLVADQLGTFAAVVDPANGTVMGFEPTLNRWMHASVPADAVQGLADANLALIGPSLFVVGSRPEDSQRAPAWEIDILGRAPKPLPMQLPARLGAKLVLSTDRQSLLLVGGTDTNSQAHDDVWTAPIPAGDRPWVAAIRARADSGNASVASSTTSVVAGSSDGQMLRAWSVTTESGGGVITPMARTDRGWVQLDERHEPVAASCPDGDAVGGQLCKLAGAWWAGPGVRACSDAAEPGRCAGSAGELTSELSANLQRVVVDAATDGSSAWVLTRNTLHRFASDGLGHLREVGSAQLHGTGLALAVSTSEVLVGTSTGVQVAQMRNGGLQVGPPTELCGRPLRLAPVAPSLWAVNTTLGTVLVSTGRDGPPAAVSTFAVVPAVSGHAETHVLPTDAAGLSVCGRLDQLLDDRAVEMLARYAPLSAVRGTRLLVARGPFVVALDVAQPEAPVALRSELVHTALTALRVDEIGQRAYGVGDGVPRGRHPVLNLASGALDLVGQHDVAKWVARHDAGRLSVQVQGGRVVKVAEVAR